MQFIDLGRLRFHEASAVQKAAVQEVVAGVAERVFLVEHEPVITLGWAAKDKHLLVDATEVHRHGAELVRCERGGKVVCHYPGQLTVYPILRVLKRGGVRQYIHDLEESLLRCLQSCGLEGKRWKGRPGVYVRGRKAGFTGIALRRWVTYHGACLNVSEDVSLFSCIVPCGLKGMEATSVNAERLRAGLEPLGMEEVKELYVQAFREVFTPAAVAADKASE